MKARRINVALTPASMLQLSGPLFLGYTGAMLAQSGVPVPLPQTVADWNSGLMIFGYLGVGVWLVSQGFAFVKYRNESTSSKLQNDDKRIENIEKMLGALKDQLSTGLTNLEKDLIGRRAAVDLQISHLQWNAGQIDKRMNVYDSRERKNLRKLSELETRMRPWLREFEPEGTRSVASVFAEIDKEETPTEDGARD